MADLVSASAQAIADALAPSPQAPAARWRWGSVVSVNADGTMNVSIGGATVPSIRCAQHVMGAQVGDRVRVMYCGTEAMVDAVRASSSLMTLPTIADFSQAGGTVTLDSTSRAAWLSALAPDVLYNDPTGTGGAVTLSASAADYDHMCIYTRKNNDSSAEFSTLVYKPDGKHVAIMTANAVASTTQLMLANVYISGTSITRYKTEVFANPSATSTYTAVQGGYSSPSNSLYIFRVEAW